MQYATPQENPENKICDPVLNFRPYSYLWNG